MNIERSVGEAISPELRAATAARLGVHGDFIHIPQLARALGISSTTIYAQMRRGDFPIPHRKVGSVIVVKLDDYASWFAKLTPEEQEPKAEAAPEVSPIPAVEPQAEPRHKPLPARDATERQRRAEFKARLQREVLESMRRKGFNV